MKELINLPAILTHQSTAIDALKMAAERPAWRLRPGRYGTQLAHIEAALCYGKARRLTLGPGSVVVNCEV